MADPIPGACRGHVISEQERERLLAGESIEAYDFVSKNGSAYGGIIRFDRETEKLSFEFPKISRLYYGRMFTDEEISRLEAGERLQLGGFVSKTGSEYERVVFIDGNGVMQSEFPKVPFSFRGYTFTPDERSLLESGRTLEISGRNPFWSPKKESYYGDGCKLYVGKDDSGKSTLILEFSNSGNRRLGGKRRGRK